MVGAKYGSPLCAASVFAFMWMQRSSSSIFLQHGREQQRVHFAVVQHQVVSPYSSNNLLLLKELDVNIYFLFFQTWAFGTVCFKMVLKWVILSMSGLTALPLNAASDIFSGGKSEDKSTLTVFLSVTM